MSRFLIPIAVLVMCSFAAADEARLLRFPDVHQDRVTFVYAGDLYTAPRAGGQAVRLTSHEGLELFPKFSPDGSRIAFTGQYDGESAVYWIDIAGGNPVRLTWHPGHRNLAERHGPENIVMGWSNDGSTVWYRSRKHAMDGWEGRIYGAVLSGGLPQPLPMPTAGFTSLSPDESKAAYCPTFRDFRQWKRYKGGMAQDVWIYDLKTNESEKITDWIGTDNMPMWYQNRIYFNSDRTGRLNLYCYDLDTKETRAVTSYTDYDVRWPSLGPDAIVFEKGGYLFVMDLPTEQIHRIEIQLTSDQTWMRPEFVTVSDDINEFDVSPDGNRALFRARGDLFTVPAKHGNTRNLTNSSNANEREIQWSPDGKWVVAISDETGEDELYLYAHDGSDKIRLTTNGSCWRYSPTWSPDSKKIVFSDKNLAVYSLDVESKAVTEIDRGERNEIRGFSFSPDSRFIAYSKNLENQITAIFVYSYEDRKVHQVTPGLTDDFSPVFDPDGKYLYFMSRREFNPILSNYEFQFVNQAMTNLYLILLQADGKSPFAPESDEVSIDTAKGDGDEKADKGDKKGDTESKKDDAKPPVKIDFDGIYDREVAFDLPTGNYGGLAAVSGAVFYSSFPLFGLQGKVTQDETTLHKYDMKDKKDNVFAEGVGGYALSANGEKMIVRKGNGYFIIGTSGPKASFEDASVNTSQMQVKVDRRQEYRNMFDQTWRMMRDFFYDPDMHGVDWAGMRELYSPLVDHCANRFDLTYVLAEMIGELCCSHTYTGGGDMPRTGSSDVGLFGCDFEVDRGSNRIKISRLLTGENWDDELRSPLTEPGIDVREGDYLLAIDGQEVTAAVNPYSLTEEKAGKLVTLTVNARPTMDGAREVTIKAIGSETRLRYHDWVQANKAYVDAKSDGAIGYIHIPDMGGDGLVRFTKMFYHQMRKPGIIIDVRYNGGGFVSDLVLERLRRTVVAMGNSRNMGFDRSPGAGILAHMVTLQNEFSCSDGDIFPYMFREYKLGPLMGTRTWGGVVGIRGGKGLIDGGYTTIPEFGMFNLDGEWVVENEGVVPDIEVVNTPTRRAAGHDDQLDAAIANIMQRLKDQPLRLPDHPGPAAPR
ncbi:MAG: PDZ domain-containing protein [candidate division Zixibacteria bacterium]|jgi:tricorn protease|nr:PDZ domain-containing protein [candidate division Zixibacteria bacterium]